MLWECIVASIIMLVFVLILLSVMYVRFVTRKELDGCGAIILIALLISVIVLTMHVLLSFQANLLVLFLLFLFVIAPIFAERSAIAELLKRAIPVEYKLEGVETRLYVYADSYIDAFLWKGRMYVHEELF